MPENVKVSVIVPFYKVEKYFRRCLESLVNQTLREIEIILIDDCGGDKSIDIAKEFAQNDSRINIIINEKNSGQGHSRNIGIKLAKGEYVAFVDSDDWVEHAMFEALYNNAKEFNSEIVKSGFKFIYSNAVVSSDMTKICPDFAKAYSVYDNPVLFLGATSPYIWNGIYRTDFLRKNNFFFELNIKAEDQPFYWFTMINAQRISFENKFLYNYNNSNVNSDSRGTLYTFIYPNIKNIIKPYIKDKREFHTALILHTYRHFQWVLSLSSDKKKVFKEFSNLVKGLDKKNIKELYEYEENSAALRSFLKGNFSAYSGGGNCFKSILKIIKIIKWSLLY